MGLSFRRNPHEDNEGVRKNPEQRGSVIARPAPFYVGSSRQRTSRELAPADLVLPPALDYHTPRRLARKPPSPPEWVYPLAATFAIITTVARVGSGFDTVPLWSKMGLTTLAALGVTAVALTRRLACAALLAAWVGFFMALMWYWI